MNEPERLSFSRRQVLLGIGIGLSAISQRQLFGADVFRGPAKEVQLELSDQEGGHVPKQVVRSNAPDGGKSIAWQFESPLRNGEAQLDRATLTASDDGRIIFSAVASSRSADDHWNVFFGLRSKSNPRKSLLVLPKQPEKQPVNSDGVPLYVWLQFPVSQTPREISYEFPRIDPKWFDQLDDVILACDC